MKEAGGIRVYNVHESPPQMVKRARKRRRVAGLFASADIAITAIACNATDKEYVYREKDAVLLCECQLTLRNERSDSPYLTHSPHIWTSQTAVRSTQGTV